ncbi:hypothetical protein LPICM17_670002 [Lactococcus piscium]|nr:hypothetical protein LP2241_50543 [Lactococcus piscium]SOB48829.1 hypothetical protein LPICM17_670002 [Lactococcus piscium]
MQYYYRLQALFMQKHQYWYHKSPDITLEEQDDTLKSCSFFDEIKNGLIHRQLYFLISCYVHSSGLALLS